MLRGRTRFFKTVESSLISRLDDLVELLQTPFKCCGIAIDLIQSRSDLFASSFRFRVLTKTIARLILKRFVLLDLDLNCRSAVAVVIGDPNFVSRRARLSQCWPAEGRRFVCVRRDRRGEQDPV